MKVPDGWVKSQLKEIVSPVLRENAKPSTFYKGLGIRSHGKGTFIKEEQSPDKIMMDTLYEVKENDLIVNITFAWEGAIAIVKKADDGALVSHRFPTYVFDKKGIPLFFQYYIIQKDFINNLGLISPGGAGRNRVLNKNDFLNLPILLPPLPEQKKIAEILISVDEAIQSTQAVIEQTKRVKQGLMQELLTRGIGHTKFKRVELNGKMVEVPEVWDVKRVMDVSTLIVSNVDKKIYDNETKVKLCNYLHIYRNRYITNALQFDEGSATIDELLKFGLLKGDVVITKDSEESNDIAIPSYVAEQIKDLVCGYHLAILRPHKNIDGNYLAKLFELPLINMFYQTRANGVTRFGLTLNTIQSAPVLLPPLPEQKRIAVILTSADDSTQSSQDKLAQLQTLKKGLMQDLLTGKVRVKALFRRGW